MDRNSFWDSSINHNDNKHDTSVVFKPGAAWVEDCTTYQSTRSSHILTCGASQKIIFYDGACTLMCNSSDSTSWHVWCSPTLKTNFLVHLQITYYQNRNQNLKVFVVIGQSSTELKKKKASWSKPIRLESYTSISCRNVLTYLLKILYWEDRQVSLYLL